MTYAIVAVVGFLVGVVIGVPLGARAERRDFLVRRSGGRRR